MYFRESKLLYSSVYDATGSYSALATVTKLGRTGLNITWTNEVLNHVRPYFCMGWLTLEAWQENIAESYQTVMCYSLNWCYFCHFFL